MRLLLVGNYVADKQNSMERYAEMLRREMSARGHVVRLVRPPVLFGKLTRRAGLQKWLGYIDKYLIFPLPLLVARMGWERTHICDHSNSMYLPWLSKKRRSITCHDVLAIQAAEGRFAGRRISITGRLQQRWIKHHLLKAEHVACISTATATELRSMGAQGRLEVILNPLHKPFSPASTEIVERQRAKLGLDGNKRYLLHVGSNTWYKNRPGVVRIFAALKQWPGFEQMHLVMAGQPLNTEVRTTIAELGLNCVIQATGLSDTELMALYTGAEALLFPSLYEGFGWPVLEAQNCGCPVITSNREPMMEVAGGTAILVPPDDPEAAAEEIARRWPERDALREAGFRNTERFEISKTAARYEAFFMTDRIETGAESR